MRSTQALAGGREIFSSPTGLGPRPGDSETVTGPDFCMVPGLYKGTITLRDASAGGVASGATRDLQLSSSFVNAFGPDGGSADRSFGVGVYDASTGTFTIPYENVFSNPGRAIGSWSQPRMEHFFQNSSTDPAFFVTGGSRLEFSQPTGALTFDPGAFVDTSAGGSWTGSLEPGTRIADRAARTFPLDYNVCYGTLRVQINSRTALFFDPRISAYTGSEVDDAGTPGDPSDDTIYGVFPQGDWSGSPRTSDVAANTGFVNMRLPRGLYTGIGGTIRTVLAPDEFGTTVLPSINLDVALDCGDACTAVPNAILCLSPIDRCNDPSIVGTGAASVSGTLNHTFPIAEGFYRINDGAEVPIDLAAAGVTCSPAPCSDRFTTPIAGFDACHNRIEISFVDQNGDPISAFLGTTLDAAPPVYHVSPRIDPAQPVYVCGTPIPYSPSGNCTSILKLLVPLPAPGDDCSTTGDPDSPLILTSDAPLTFPQGTTHVHLGAVDSCGNGALCDVPVVIADTTAPRVGCANPNGDPSGYTLLADSQCLGPATIAATIGDNCDPIGALTIAAQIQLPGGGVVTSIGPSVTYGFPPGDSLVTFTATDTKNNTGTCSVAVHVVDEIPPSLQCPYNETIGLDSPNAELDGLLLFAGKTGAPPDTHLTWTGGTGTYRLIRVPAPAHLGMDPHFATLGAILLASDPGHVYDDSTYGDGVNYFYRVFRQEVGIRSFECQSAAGAVVNCQGSVTDNCAVASVSNSKTGGTLDASGLYPLGDTSIDFSATDTSSNMSACASTVRVVDTTPPIVQCPADLTLTISDPAGLPASAATVQAWMAGASANDLCGPATLSNDAPAVFPATCAVSSATTTVTFTATDQQGLTSSCTATVTIVLDQDGDGFVCASDCDDTRANVHPGATEVCDGLDNDCNGTVDGFATACGVGACASMGICSAGVDSCAPGVPKAETCNGIDDDCDGVIDGFPTTCGAGACASTGVCNAGSDSCAPGSPGVETCNGIDDDCDGTVDEGCGPGKVTGGGEIDVPGGTSSYGFVVQRKTAGDPVTGQLEYYNHARGLDVHSVDMLSLSVTPTTATFTGTCRKNNTTPCTFSVTVEDNGEPGKGVDRFTISVSDEPVEGDQGPILHGNIQIHAN
jgi:hypothetical protein